jgi:ribosomal protein L11 methyltransferase
VRAEELRARFIEIAPEGFEEHDRGARIELAAYGDAARRVVEVFPEAVVSEVAEGWEERWRAFHRPVELGPLWLGPPWLQPSPGLIAVVIEPGRAFGTGAHATTRLCLEFLLEEPRGELLDVGCGSGVLAIAAAKLGFGPLLAIDVDPIALDVAAANARANGVELELAHADALADALPASPLAVANVALDVVEGLAGRLSSERLIASGYPAVAEPALAGFDRVQRRELDGWAADLLVRR